MRSMTDITGLLAALAAEIDSAVRAGLPADSIELDRKFGEVNCLLYEARTVQDVAWAELRAVNPKRALRTSPSLDDLLNI